MTLLYSIIVFIIVIAVLLTAKKKISKGNNVTIEEFISAVRADSHLSILDVRNPDELEGPLGKINASINIPSGELTARIGELEPVKKNTIYVICRSGARSLMASRFLSGKGFKVKNVTGGMKAYRSNVK